MQCNFLIFLLNSGASSCFQLFMTFLQAQLAEAINLQDRSVVAQLHETLRSIRQLPSDRYLLLSVINEIFFVKFNCCTYRILELCKINERFFRLQGPDWNYNYVKGYFFST